LISEDRLPPANDDLYAVPNGPTLFAALPDQLGLQLQKRKRSVDVLVVDSALRVPIAN
jgi:uncharacterized protein (TIGR03435 family)